ncbi:hypothetical protein AVE30378_02530 [Achromobacter veterisilvae]|uniref:HTH cro/C1-type domain-containing protein n=1 Tax=Achromobacter veterisilvae TaxID=2069367 RepID=A0A446CHG9_9BURK|nr:helix-turn-helix transcriptional regulator [Achromobacter veterisilvae]SSW67258.1 hypothetical protein AVE30378_02530 [Achromobacter veterisilvae]
MPDVKEILAQSVTKLLETRQDISRLNLSKLMGVADGTLGRIKYGSGNPNVETVQQIARFFKFEAWQLLVSGFDPLKPPALDTSSSSSSVGTAQPPVTDLRSDEQELLSIFRILNEPERTYLMLNARGYSAAYSATQDGPDIKSKRGAA